MFNRISRLGLATIILASACGEVPVTTTNTELPAMSNPLATASPLVFQAPVFDKLKDSDYEPAIEAGMKKQLEEVRVISENKEPATFENTIVAMEKSGVDLARASKIFFGLTGSATNDTLQAIKARVAPKLTAHGDAITLNDALFQRVKSVYDGRANAGLDPVSTRLIERYYTRFVRAGAMLDAGAKEQMKKLNEEESNLSTKFQDNILKARSAASIIVDKKEQLDGLSDEAIAAAADAAKAKGQEGKWLIEIVNTTTQPVLVSLKDRSLRERIYKASISRNSSGDTDNSKIVARLAQLRGQKAKLLGFPNWAAYVMDDQMAKTPEAALKLLGGLAPAAARNAKAEAVKHAGAHRQAEGRLQAGAVGLGLLRRAGAQGRVRPGRGRDEAVLRTSTACCVNGVFYAANEMYGLTFKERKDMPVYHPDVRVFDVFDAGGKVDRPVLRRLLRPRQQERRRLDGQLRGPVRTARPAAGGHPELQLREARRRPARAAELRRRDHALPRVRPRAARHVEPPEVPALRRHGHRRATSSSSPRSSTKHWATDPAVLGHYAKHYRTGEAMPAELIQKMKNAKTFNQGYATSEYIAAALLDIEWHRMGADAALVTDVQAYEDAALAKYGLLNPQVPPRYKTNYFSHIWGGGYSANYYAYMWSEVLDADGCAWFAEKGGFNRANGMHFRSTVLSQGGSKESGQLYRDFTGRDARLEPLLERRGLN